MTPKRDRVIAAVLLSIALLSSDLATPSSPAMAAPAGVGVCSNGWQELFVPAASLKDIPMAAVTRGGALEWVVGGGHRGPLALRWTGSELVAEDLSDGRRRGLAAGVPRGGPTSLVGGYQRPSWGAEISPLLGRVQGTRFIRDRVRISDRVNAAVADVVDLPRGRGWAVGTYLSGGQWRALALRRTGGSWRRADLPSRGRSSGFLGVARTPSGTVWAAGWREVNGVMRPLLARRATDGWKTTTGARLPAGPAILTDVAFEAARSGWAIGYLRPGGSPRHVPILERWDGQRWQRVELPWDGASAIPQSLAVGTAGDVWIAGTQLATAEREPRGFVAHGHGGGWTMRFIDTPPDLASSLQSVDVTTDGAVVTGTIGSTAIVLRSCDVAGTAEGGRRIAIAGLKRRARVVDRHVVDDGMPVIAEAGVSVRLAAPTAPSGFRIADVADATGIGEVTRTYQALVSDLDGNGWQDVFISRHQGAPKLALGGPDGFAIAPNTAFSAADRHACDVADVDRDGSKDILCVTGRRYGTSVDRHELSLGVAGPNPRLEREALGIEDPLGRGRDVAFIRLDRDAYPEVLIVDEPEREDVFLATNRFYRNRGGRFVAAPGVGLDRPVGGHCAEGIDVDGDKDQDLLLCARFPYDGRAPGLRIYRNAGGRLRERSAALGVAPMGDVDVALADVDGDGRRDLIQLAANRLRVSRRTASGFRRIYQVSLDKAVAVAAGDVNGDGKADLYVVRGGADANRGDRLLVNDGRGRSFTSVRIPQAGRGNGRGDDVVALDHDRNGLTDFLVLNGRGSVAGPIQLLAAFPAEPA